MQFIADWHTGWHRNAYASKRGHRFIFKSTTNLIHVDMDALRPIGIQSICLNVRQIVWHRGLQVDHEVQLGIGRNIGIPVVEIVLNNASGTMLFDTSPEQATQRTLAWVGFSAYLTSKRF